MATLTLADGTTVLGTLTAYLCDRVILDGYRVYSRAEVVSVN
jgi:hypothetical protein